MTNVCGKCEQKILFGDEVFCSGKCSAYYHRSCMSLTKSAGKVIDEVKNLQFRCDECLGTGVDSDVAVLISDVTAIKEEMQKHSVILNSISGIIEGITTQIDNAIKKEMENGLKSCVEMFQEQIKTVVVNSVAEKLEKIMNMKLEKMNIERKINKPIRKRGTHSESDGLPGSKRRAVNTVDTEPMVVDDEQMDEVFEEFTFADVLKGLGNGGNGSGIGNGKGKENNNKNGNEKVNNNHEKKERRARPLIVIKPTELNQSNDETRTFLKSCLDPKIHKISNFRNGKDGSIILECATGDIVTKVKNDIESNFGQKYTSTVPSGLPRLKIVGMSEKYSPEKFIDLLMTQNEEIFIKELKVISLYENPRLTYNKFGAIIEVNNDTFDSLIMAKKVSIGWDRCSVFEAINILRCFKCGEFGHMSTACKNEEKCSACGESHKTSECTSTVMKCVNCLKKNNEQKMNLDVGHAAYSSQCPVFKHLVAVKKDRMFTDE